MRRWQGRTNEPLMWALFGGGGMLAVFTMPVLIIAFGLLVPFGGFGGADGTYERMHALLTHPLVSLLVLHGGVGAAARDLHAVPLTNDRRRAGWRTCSP